MTWQLGDTVPVTVTLTVTPDGTTVISLALKSPTNVASAPSLTGSGLTRSATFVASEVGRWTAVATVTGTGAGVSPPMFFDVEAITQIPAIGTTGLHATTKDYVEIIGGELPDNLQRLLRLASLDVDRELIASSYDADDADVLTALAIATCEQVAYLLENGWDNGVPTGYDEVKIGSVTLKRGQSGGGTPAPFSSHAYDVLQLAGLTGHAPWTG